MLPGGTDPLYRQALAAGHEHYVRIEVWSGLGFQLPIPSEFAGDREDSLVYFNGTLSATLNSRVTRNVSLTVPGALYPSSPTDLLAPFGNELRIYRGVYLGDGSDVYTWQVFRGRIRNIRKTSAGICQVSCSDRAADVVDNKFVSPQNSQPNNTVYQEFRRLIQDAVAAATFGASDPFAMLVQPLSWELDRAAALDEMATAASGLWFSLANGDFVIRLNPWAVPTNPVLTLSDQTGGTVNSWARERDRDSIFNIVTTTGERLNGDAPVYATAEDTNPASPTDVNGGFGVRSLLNRLQTPATQGAAQAASNATLSTSIAPVEAWTLGTTADAALELGDVLRLQVDGADVVQVVSAFTLPLDLGGDMSVSTRSLVINQLAAEVLS